MNAATASLNFSTKKHQDWFDSNNASIKQLLTEKNAAHAAKLQNPSSTVLHQKWKQLRSCAQKELRQAENKWWSDKANEIQSYADANETQKFYDTIKAAYGPRHHSVHPVRTKDDVTLMKDQQGILSR